MFRRGPLLLLVSLVLLSGWGCGLGRIRGSGQVTERQVLLANFQNVELESIGTLYIELGREDVLRIEAEDNIMRHIQAEVRGDTLHIDTSTGVILRPRKPVKYYLTARSLQGITISGSGDVQASDLYSDDFQITIRGSGNLSVGKLNTDRLQVTISGSGKAELDEVRAELIDLVLSGSGRLNVGGGSANEQLITISGSGRYEAKDLLSQTAAVDILGDGTAIINVRQELEANMGGSGTLRYCGSPIVESNIASSGKIERIGD